jgi:NAD(P)-dependent dehydrogenase (short-subunit alcohol dehydrogenase family)
LGRLTGKTAVITGGSAGLGPVMGALFVREGARVLLAARRESMVQEAAAAAGDGAIGFRADVTVEEDVSAMIDRAIDEFGPVDIMVNNAGVDGENKWVWEQTLEGWNATLAINLTASMLCTREVLKRSMLDRGSGVIINVSSAGTFKPPPQKGDYVTAKAALREYTQVVADEVGPKGIRCNCIVPGSIDTATWRTWIGELAAENKIDYETQRARRVAMIPLRDISKPEDVANLAVFLASDESRMITGQSILVDGGKYKLG